MGGTVAPGSYEEALSFIHSLYRFGSRPGLARPRRLLGALGDPQAGLRVVHVAGTNGKGSVAAMLASIFRAAGYRTGLYISPYLDEFGERMSVDGQPITPEETAAIVLGQVRPAVEALAPSSAPNDQVVEFEATTALGFLYFASRRVDLLVSEVGLGGRFDATNVVDRPLLSVITSIGLDHTDRLGATVPLIAAEKAGIIKRGAPVVSAPQTPEALAVVQAAARRRDCPFYLADGVTRRSSSLGGQVIDFSGPGFPAEEGMVLPLLGSHQLDNAAAALTAAGVLRERGQVPRLDSGSLRRGLAATLWPGRFEVFGGGPDGGAGGAPGRPTIVVDGAHNPPGAVALAAALREFAPGRRLILVLGILGDKDVGGYLDVLLPPAMANVAAVFTCRPSSPRARSPEDLATRVAAACPGLPVEARATVTEALRQAVALAGPGDVVCVAGSIYQLGEARAAAARLAGPTA